VVRDKGCDVGTRDRLRHVVVGSGQQASIDLELRSTRTEQDHRNVRKVALASDPPTHFDPTETGQLHVKEDHTRVEVGQHLDCLPSVLNRYGCKTN
jgi:hypothetical protein